MKRTDYMWPSVGPRPKFGPRISPYSSPMGGFSPSPPPRQFDPFTHSTPRFNSPRSNNSSSQPNTPRNKHYSTNSSSDFIPLSDGSQCSGSGLGSWQSYHNPSPGGLNGSGQRFNSSFQNNRSSSPSGFNSFGQRFNSGFPKRRNRQNHFKMAEQSRNIQDFVTPSILEDPWADLVVAEKKKESA